MSETATVQVAEAKFIKDGTGQKGPWSLWHIVDGNGERFATFSKSVYESALPLVGKRAEVEYTENDKGKTLSAIREASTNGDTPPLGTGEYVTGQKPAIEVRRIFASTAWNCAARMAQSDLGFEAAQHLADKIFYDLLKKGQAVTDEDIPF